MVKLFAPINIRGEKIEIRVWSLQYQRSID